MQERHRFERELADLDLREHDQAQPPTRLSAHALGDAFAEFQTMQGVPDEAIKRLRNSPSFRKMASRIDKNYVAVQTLMDSGEPGDMADHGRLIKGKIFKGRRVLLVGGMITTTAFHRARSIDNLGTADSIEIAAPPKPSKYNPNPDQWLAIRWIGQILLMVAQVNNAAVIKGRSPASLRARINACIKAQVEARRQMDNVFLEIEAADKDFKIGIMFDEAYLSHQVEIGYYPADLLIETPFILTNLEHCVLTELMEESWHREKLDENTIDRLKTTQDAKPLGDVTSLAEQLNNLHPSDFATFYLARRLIDRRWRLLDPSAFSDKWNAKEVKEMRLANAKACFPKGIAYSK